MTARVRNESGAISMLAGAGLLAALASIIVAVDIGRIGLERRRLQDQVDIAALDAARTFGSCTSTPLDPTAAAQAGAEANGFEGSLAAAPNRIEVGDVTTEDGYRVFEPTGDTTSAQAVRVAAETSIPRSRILGSLSGNMTLRTEAVARSYATAGIWVGSRLLDVDSTKAPILNEVLSGLTGGSVNLSAATWEDVANANVTLGDLQQAADSSDMAELLATTLGPDDYARMLAAALREAGNEPAAAAMDQIAEESQDAPQFEVGDLIATDGNEKEASLGMTFNAFDLLTGGLQLTKQGHTMELSSVNIPGLASGSARLYIVEPPKEAKGPPGRDADGEWRTHVTTSQARLQLDLTSTTPLTLIGSEPLRVSVCIDLAPTTAWLESIDCARYADPVHRLSVGAQPGVTKLSLGSFSDIATGSESEETEVAELEVLGIPVARISASGEAQLSTGSQSLSFDGPFEEGEQSSQRVGYSLDRLAEDGSEALSGDLTVEVEVLGGLPLGVTTEEIRDAAAEILEPILADLDEVLEPVAMGLGVDLGGGEVKVLGVDATQPRLVR